MNADCIKSEIYKEEGYQLINYLRITKQPVGYLINFGSKGGLEKRIMLSEFIPEKLASISVH